MLTFIGGVDIGDSFEGSGDCGLLLSPLLSSVWLPTTFVAKTLNGLGGRLRSFKLGGTIGSCHPNPYGIVGSLESSLSAKIWGSGDAIEEIVGIFVVRASDMSAELRKSRELLRCGL